MYAWVCWDIPNHEQKYTDFSLLRVCCTPLEKEFIWIHLVPASNSLQNLLKSDPLHLNSQKNTNIHTSFVVIHFWNSWTPISV